MNDAPILPAQTQLGDEIVLDAANLRKTYGRGEGSLSILQGVNLQVRRGEIVAILGASGVGKTTLLNLLGLLDRPDGGSIRILGKDTTRLSSRQTARLRNKSCGFIFQFYHLLHEFSALDNVLLPLKIANSIGSWSSVRSKAVDRAQKLLADVGLKDRMYHRPAKLSGGERQRVAVARALVTSPDILFCDEPTGNLDVATARSIRDLLWWVNREYRTAMVLVTHDLSIAQDAHRILVLLANGQLRQVSREEAARGALTLADLEPGSAAGEPSM